MAIKRDAADMWCSRAVRLRDKYCMRCGSPHNLEAMHCTHGRRNKRLRYSLDNLQSGCTACHRYYTENPLEFLDDLRRLWGEGHIDMLREKGREIMKTTKELRKEIAKHYREEVNKKLADDDYTIVSYN